VDSLAQQHKLIAVSDLATGSLRPPPSLLDGFLLDRTITQIASTPYTGKSILMLAIMLALDTGIPLMGRFPIPKRKPSLFLAFDGRHWDYVQLINKLARGMGLSQEEISRVQSYVKFRRPGWKLTSPEIREHLKAIHGELGFGVLFLDTFRRFHTLNQNDDREMASFMETLIELSDDLKIAIIFSNHTAKPTEANRGGDANYSARGSTEISAAVDFNLVLRKRAKGIIRLDLPKGRGASSDDLDSLDFSLVYGGTADAPSVSLVPLNNTAAHDTLRHAWENLGKAEITRAQLIDWAIAAGHDKAPRLVDTGMSWLRRHNQIKQVEHGRWQLVNP
jgi:AAA domain-containing protein